MGVMRMPVVSLGTVCLIICMLCLIAVVGILLFSPPKKLKLLGGLGFRDGFDYDDYFISVFFNDNVQCM